MEIIDQLVYTWSDTGLSGRTVGFRIRAASQGLGDAYSQRYRNLEYYLDYNLPQGVRAASIVAARAPVCLALLNTRDGRILLRKELLSADKVGRSGAFLTHLIAGLPPSFSAREAIQLWHSDLWVTSKRPLDPQQLWLDPVDERKLFSQSQPDWEIASLDDFRASLQLALAHFLGTSSSRKLCLTGASESVAALIWGVTQSLPSAVIREMTFSTYESGEHVTGETIVGFFSAEYVPPGENHIDVDNAARLSLPELDKLAEHYVDFAADALCQRMQHPRGKDPLSAFLKKAEAQRVSSVGALLTCYEEAERTRQQSLTAQSEPARGKQQKNSEDAEQTLLQKSGDRRRSGGSKQQAPPGEGSIQQPILFAPSADPLVDSRPTASPVNRSQQPDQPVFPGDQQQRPAPSSTDYNEPRGTLLSSSVQRQAPPSRDYSEQPGLRQAQYRPVSGQRGMYLSQDRAEQRVWNDGGLVGRISTKLSEVWEEAEPVRAKPRIFRIVLFSLVLNLFFIVAVIALTVNLANLNAAHRRTPTSTPTLPNNAIIVLNGTVPLQAAAGKTLSFAVGVKNTGSETWGPTYHMDCIPATAKTNERYCSKQRNLAGVPMSVAAGGDIVFQAHIPLSRSDAPGTYTITIQMFQGAKAFGTPQLLHFTIT